MLNVFRILVSTACRALALAGVAVTLSGCGQKGDLFLPTDPAAAQRATLIESLRPTLPSQPPTPAIPATPVTSATPGTPGVTTTDSAPPAPSVEAVPPASSASAPR